VAELNRRSYRKSLGVVELFCLGIGGTIGSGIFVVPGIAAGLAGPGSLVAWVVVALSACLVAFALGSMRPSSGATFSVLLTEAFGRGAGAALIAMYVLASVFGIATIAAGLGQYLSYFGVTELRGIELAIVAAFLTVNLIGMTLSGATENVLSLIKVAAMIAMILVLTPSMRADNFVPFTLPSAPTLLSVAIIVYWPFTGFEISAIPVAETKDPRRIAAALLLVMVFVCAVYLALNVALIGAVGATDLAASPAPVAYAMGLVLPGSGPFVAAVGIVTMLSALNACCRTAPTCSVSRRSRDCRRAAYPTRRCSSYAQGPLRCCCGRIGSTRWPLRRWSPRSCRMSRFVVPPPGARRRRQCAWSRGAGCS